MKTLHIYLMQYISGAFSKEEIQFCPYRDGTFPVCQPREYTNQSSLRQKDFFFNFRVLNNTLLDLGLKLGFVMSKVIVTCWQTNPHSKERNTSK